MSEAFQMFRRANTDGAEVHAGLVETGAVGATTKRGISKLDGIILPPTSRADKPRSWGLIVQT
jgi:hypothetical protein